MNEKATTSNSTVNTEPARMASLSVPSPQPVSASSGGSHKMASHRSLSTHGLPKAPRTMSPERPHRFSALGFPSPSSTSATMSPRSPGPMSPPPSARSFGTFIDSEPSTPAYSPRMDHDWDNSTLVLLRPLSSSSAPSTPTEPVWDMMPMQLPQKPMMTTRSKTSVPRKDSSVSTTASSYPVKQARLVEPPKQVRLLDLAQMENQTPQERDNNDHANHKLEEEQNSNPGTAPLGKLASKMRLLLRRKNTNNKKKAKKEKDYYDVHRMDDVHWTEIKILSSHNGLSNSPVLRSAFPTKTVLFLLVLGGLVYYFVDVREEDWTDDIYTSYVEDQNQATPLHFYANKEELAHWIQFHIPDPSAPLKDPNVAQFFSDQFDKLAFGWMMTKEDASRDGMPLTHGVRFRSNEPCEDYYALGTSPGPGERPWNYWSIMDGHAGRHTAFYLQWTLIPHLSSALLGLPATSSSPEIVETIKRTFLRVDKQIMDSARTAANWFPAANAAAIAALTPAFSGSCALLAAFDPANDTLRVACTGDSRAVLGRWDPSSQSYTTIPLSVDQTGFNEKEVERLAAEHPDEPDIIDPKSGRLLGIAVTRAFGDHRWKWDNDFIKAVQCKFWGTAPRSGSKTPPYMTAEPEVTETEVVRVDAKDKGARGKSDFMIMASDGLWDRISSEHAVECVERWLDAKDRGNGSVKNDPQLLANPPVFPTPFALDSGVDVDVENGKEVDWQATPEYFAIEDENAAVCLARNAMGGTRRGLFFGILSVPGPLGRNAVDDTTIMVVFFDKLGEGPDVKAKTTKRSWWPW
ncbi:protein serine/threonine phosphatase 2C [Cucurbitaria berberidis CBS 394.84]|uniref:Protein serine/threonine phosphatase 2C n=1 Tax=Cucurbitaria berberidis CBS 394.84 TaxID=1168544 RepID=A0A9P4GUD3_9PLEO|nr:protein serine/threonine phosphatase 2C [Cucurbitaria berberidis CBS 394.84]KAF1851439.1 protein serine/threonine phosphatase 2C [Cucurbitaria berberidis CBS 394.84]